MPSPAIFALFLLSLTYISTSLPFTPRQQPEYFDGYGYLTPDTFSIDLYTTSSSSGTIQRYLNISTSYGGAVHTVVCPSSSSSSSNSSTWLDFPSPNVPGSDSPVLQGDIRLLPGNFCEAETEPQCDFDGTMLEYQGDQVAVATDDSDCDRYSGPDGQLDEDGPVARCVFALTPA